MGKLVTVYEHINKRTGDAPDLFRRGAVYGDFMGGTLYILS